MLFYEIVFDDAYVRHVAQISAYSIYIAAPSLPLSSISTRQNSFHGILMDLGSDSVFPGEIKSCRRKVEGIYCTRFRFFRQDYWPEFRAATARLTRNSLIIDYFVKKDYAILY